MADESDGSCHGESQTRVAPEHYQIFYLHSVKGMPARDVAELLGASVRRFMWFATAESPIRSGRRFACWSGKVAASNTAPEVA